MKLKLSLVALATLPFFSIAQEKNDHCSRIKGQNSQTKSNTFTLAEIAETERYDVHFYFIKLNMTNTTTTLSGTTEIQASARENLDTALIELFPDFVVSEIRVNGIPTAYSRSNSAIRVPVNALVNESFSIEVDYAGTPPNGASNPLGGGGMTNDDSPTWGNSVTWSLSEPFSAYEWFPVKQSLRDKADSSAMHITVPIACKAGSNGVLEQVVDLGDGTHRFEWKHRHEIDYYLISVAVAEYIEYNLTAFPSNSPPVFIQNFIYNNPNTLINFQDEIDETVDFIELFADVFGPYPFADEKYGHCMAPLGGGMEHQTMTTQGSFNRGLTSHELAHQWWGDHVTCASWSDIWVNEGFASYSEYIMLENLYPGQQVQDMLDRHDNIKLQLGGSVWVEDSLNVGRIFSGRLTYDKGAAIIHTLRFLVDNDSLFFEALREYQSIFADSVALGVDFIAVMEDITGMDFTAFMEEWYYGEGFPTYTARWNQVGNDFLLEVNQTTSVNSITPYFTNDLEIRLDRQSLPDTIIRVQITGNQTQFQIPNLGTINNLLSFDPANWIINNNGAIIHDLNFNQLGIEELEENAVTIYPNPSNGPFTVSMKDKGNYSLTVLDTKGRVLKQLDFENETTIDLSAVSSGSYLIQVSNDAGLKARRIVKK